MKPHNIDASDLYFPQDELIHFNEAAHLYSTDQLGILTPVSNVVKYFFPEFDAIKISLKKTYGDVKEAEKLREQWTINGQRAATIGTFLHLQIENYLNRCAEPQLTGTYLFNGKFNNINEQFNIAREWQYFLNFDRATTYHPFRTEWRIFDPEHRIAGAIDLLCRCADGTFEIYDWKRSSKVNPNEKNQWSSSINGLTDIPDTSFWHYVLQQNLYRYIIEKNYGIKVSRMNLVVLHPDLDGYQVVPVPKKEDAVETMLRCFKG